MTINACVVIPVFNHHKVIEETVSSILEKNYSVILVDDGSNDATKEVLKTIADASDKVFLNTLPENLGKGGAVKAGFRSAIELNFTHALQVDADGQHNLDDIDQFMNISKENPDAVICGYPQYDESVPKHRYYARYLTHIWVWIECLSMAIKDSMCGFRVYPLAAVAKVLDTAKVGDRMDFDTEILVRLYWKKTPILNTPTHVIYPEDGESHFQLWRDNWLISKMHTRLFFGMLIRSPSLLLRHLKKSKAASSEQASSADKGSRLGLKILSQTYRLVGIKPVYWMLYPIILYYTITASAQRKHSLNYLNKLYKHSKKDIFESKPGFWQVYRHFYSFAQINADKFIAWSGNLDDKQVEIPNRHLIDELINSQQGAMFIISHVGNFDIGRSLSHRYADLKLNFLVDYQYSTNFNKTLQSLAKESSDNLIHMADIGVDTAILLQERIDKGEVLTIGGDRISENTQKQTTEVEFLGSKAPIGVGPFILAHLLGCPIYSLACLKHKSVYRIYFKKLSDPVKFTRKERQQKIQALAQSYADTLAELCEEEPYQWFNFFDFWKR